jgi:flagellar basal body rod protein FlgC|tara:strand:+ start:110 stop:316 length:207 start_codon:yes stop_codon:yes gene_type:complete
MTANEFYLWLKGYLEALETEGIETCKIERILLKMDEVKSRNQQERIVFGPNVNPSTQQGYVQQPPTRK